MAEAGPGKIRLFNDFAGPEQLESLTATSHYIGQFRVVGEGFADATVGIVGLESAGLNGVIRIESGATDQDSTGLVTSKMFDVALMGPIVMEARVQFNTLDTKEFFFGLSDVNEDDVALETDILGATAGTTIAPRPPIRKFMQKSVVVETAVSTDCFKIPLTHQRASPLGSISKRITSHSPATASTADSTLLELVSPAVAPPL